MDGGHSPYGNCCKVAGGTNPGSKGGGLFLGAQQGGSTGVDEYIYFGPLLAKKPWGGLLSLGGLRWGPGRVGRVQMEQRPVPLPRKHNGL